jgi:hypothetical protein
LPDEMIDVRIADLEIKWISIDERFRGEGKNESSYLVRTSGY